MVANAPCPNALNLETKYNVLQNGSISSRFYFQSYQLSKSR